PISPLCLFPAASSLRAIHRRRPKPTTPERADCSSSRASICRTPTFHRLKPAPPGHQAVSSMTSPMPLSSPTNRARLTPAASSAGVLSPDMLFDVLLRLPAKELCRLRAVCRCWRSLTIDPLFISAHADLQRSPLFLARFQDDKVHIHVMDSSGNLVKRIAIPRGHQLLCTQLELACVASPSNSCCVLNPATGGLYALPRGPALVQPQRESLRRPDTFVFGRVPSTGEYKVIRTFNRAEFPHNDKLQPFEVFTLNGAASIGQWRILDSRDFIVEASSAVVVDGAVYFLMNSSYNRRGRAVTSGIPADYIASLDIEREEWRRDLQGPISGSPVIGDLDARDDYMFMWPQLALADLKGSLVLSYYRRRQFILDLWFLKDFEDGHWVKEYSIRTGSISFCLADEYRVKPLLMLDDGRLVIYAELTGLLLICDPQTNTLTEVETKHLDSVSVYAGNLLSLQEGNIV
ncbi:hypothetical protein EJB05_13159, partial [Eragrostis curvula]